MLDFADFFVCVVLLWILVACGLFVKFCVFCLNGFGVVNSVVVLHGYVCICSLCYLLCYYLALYVIVYV